ncbi:carboxypeptidase-like regulatory domain-containing protein [Pustulibacterium marinum]|uniref:carboxypeptidase-like regulatory domain-containing protein n=1 Tax=Pustulibacterium marinum TaxID=1224947 RepID=UPI001C42E4C4|nr:carboxypeptidase-like regulatory domain-containing protein [Pustulibacterium marinum]
MAHAQVPDSLRISGMVADEKSELLEGVYVRNMSQGTFTISTRKGKFTLMVREGDTLRFNFLGMKDLVYAIDKEDMQLQQLAIIMETDVEQLDEVEVEQQTITALSLGIIQKEVKPMTKNERLLAAAGDFRWYDVMLIPLGGMPFDPLLNAISGRTKMLKKRVQMDKENKNADALYERFYTFSTMTLGIESDDVMLFMYYLTTQGKDAEILKAEDSLAEFFLTEAYQEYKASLNEE